MDHHQCVGLMDAETTCVVKTDSVAQQATTCKTAKTANAWDAAYSQDVANRR